MVMPARRSTWPLLLGSAVLIAGAIAAAWFGQPVDDTHTATGAMLIAPAVRGVADCIARPDHPTPARQAPLPGCMGQGGSAAALVESTLRRLQPDSPQAGTGFPLGYTLTVPLLRLFRAEGADWVVDQERVQRVVHTVRDTARPLILFLSASYFAQQAPIEKVLLEDQRNLARTRDGVLPPDTYRGETLYPWSMARTDTPITARRIQAIQALLAALCALPQEDLAKIQGITLLGELHQLAPHFESGMGFTPSYRVTDYSPASEIAFRNYLQQRFTTVEKLNAAMAESYPSFDDVQLPSRDIRTEHLSRYTEHIDSFAQGSVPISGWSWITGNAEELWVQVYRDGSLIGRVPVNQGRLDVLQAKPELGSANTGWRLDMDFRSLPAGLHRISALLELAPGKLVHIGSKEIAVMGREQQILRLPPQRELPATVPAPLGMQASLDMPPEGQSLHYNPLVPLWHAFRRQQVMDYLRLFDGIVAQSCLRTVARYTHQMLPGVVPGWDANKFALDDTLRTQGDIRLGVDLHGSATHDKGFAKLLGSLGQHAYGITEFIPMRAMDTQELKTTLQRHAMRGARFLTFFLEPPLEERPAQAVPYAFSFDPHNPQFGSAQLYRAMQEILGPAPAQ